MAQGFSLRAALGGQGGSGPWAGALPFVHTRPHDTRVYTYREGGRTMVTQNVRPEEALGVLGSRPLSPASKPAAASWRSHNTFPGP